MTTPTGVIRHEILQVAEAVAREKNIDQEEVITAMEQAIQSAAKVKYGLENDIRVSINRKTSEITVSRYREVVEELEEEGREILLKDAKLYNPDVKVGEFIIDPLPPINFGRGEAQNAKQIIVQRVREAERSRQFNEFKDRVGEVVNGVVKRAEYGNVLLDVGGRAEALLRRDEMLPRENYRPGDRIRAYIIDVREEPRGAQIFLSRAHPQFMAKLFTQEVPEIYDGIIEIKAVARDPGSRAKIAVATKDNSIDPVGACVGLRGARVQAVVGELQGEKVDIVPWSEDTATFIVNSLAPAEIAKIVMDEDAGRIDVVVPDDQLSLAIGRRGQNVRLASILSGWDINILTESDDAERREKEVAELTVLFGKALDVDEMIAQLLINEGFTSVEDLTLVPLDELARVEAFDEELASEIQNRAMAFVEEEEKALDKKLKDLKVTDDLLAFDMFDKKMILTLAENDVKSRDDLADLAGDELVEILGDKVLDLESANAIIMEARSHWFDGDEAEGDKSE